MQMKNILQCSEMQAANATQVTSLTQVQATVTVVHKRYTFKVHVDMYTNIYSASGLCTVFIPDE